MKTSIIIIAFLISTFSVVGQETIKNNLICFNDFLGEEKSAALNDAVESFEQFLMMNYPEHNSQASKAKAFLKQISTLNGPDSSWIIPTKKNEKIIKAFEESGLRKEIWIYGYEDYEGVLRYYMYELLYPELRGSVNKWDTLSFEENKEGTVQDSTEIFKNNEAMAKRYVKNLHFNFSGNFLHGLLKCISDDTLIKEYVKDWETRRSFATYTPKIVAKSLLGLKIDVEDPFNIRILVVEIFYEIMKWDIQRKQ